MSVAGETERAGCGRHAMGRYWPFSDIRTTRADVCLARQSGLNAAHTRCPFMTHIRTKQKWVRRITRHLLEARECALLSHHFSRRPSSIASI
jgi:hypothetical protein